MCGLFHIPKDFWVLVNFPLDLTTMADSFIEIGLISAAQQLVIEPIIETQDSQENKSNCN